jgi:signal transduction histidine kinase
VAEERVRIARDLHDVVAHSLSVIAVQSDAAEAALKAAPERAIAPVQAVRTTAREALADIRRMLDVLRTDDAELPGVDSPGVSAVAGLADAARATGTPVTLDVRLTSGPVPPGVDLAAYRIVQESLTNARRHAPGAPVIVAVTQQQNALEVRITSAAASTPSAEPHGTGYGINGMRERAATLGGTLVAGPTPDGGFDVHATLPLPTTAETS